MSINSQELESLRLYKEDAMSALDENEQVIQSLKSRIQELEFHLTKLRDHIFYGLQATAGIVPLGATAVDKPARKSKKKQT